MSAARMAAAEESLERCLQNDRVGVFMLRLLQKGQPVI